MTDVDVFSLSYGVEESEPMPTVAEDLRSLLQGFTARLRRILRRP